MQEEVLAGGKASGGNWSNKLSNSRAQETLEYIQKQPFTFTCSSIPIFYSGKFNICNILLQQIHQESLLKINAY